MIQSWSSEQGHIAERNALWAFVDTLLRSYGQIFFCNNPFIGLLLLVATFYYPLGGIFGLIGAISANLTATLLHVDRITIRSGIFGVSGALIGLAWALYLSPSTLLVALLVPAAAFSSLLIVVLLSTLSRRLNLPILSLPFVIIAWIFILALQQFPDLPPIWQGLLNPFSAIAQLEESLRNVIPAFASVFFRTMSAIFFQDSILVGLACFVGVLIYSRLSAIFAFTGGMIGALFAFFLTSPLSSGNIIMQFNGVLIAIALGGFFVVLNLRSAIYALFAIVIGAVVSMAAESLFRATGLPLLALPFNLVTLLFLYPLGSGLLNEQKSGLQPVPLNWVASPEKSLRWLEQTREVTEMQKTELSLPFYGTWYVSQGNSGSITHWGNTRNAWDFIVLSDHNKSHKGRGRKNEDYYAFGLPVLAPAPGAVVKVINNVSDNIPSKVSKEQDWGNHVIINHWNGEFSEISHFKRDSIIVKEGEFVGKGQIIGYCGNSGLSYEAHIHYQLQRGDSVGGESIAAKFSRYAKQTKKGVDVVEVGTPKEGELVRNEK